jgi:acyl-CoA synthetase (AMP-forming)/AMP-acid ligase II
VIPRPRLAYRSQNLATFLDAVVAVDAEAMAVSCDGESLSYRELDGLANSAAQLLLELGVGPGDRVAIAFANRLEWAVVFFAALRVGAAIVTPNPRWGREEMSNAFSLTSPKVVFVDEMSAPVAAGLDARLICVDEVEIDGALGFWSGLRRFDGNVVAAPVLDWPFAEALLLFSSGTTGLPKAVRHSHMSLQAAMLNWKSAVRLSRNDRQQMVLPLFTILGASTLIGAIAAGAPLFISRRFSLDEMLEEIERERITLSTLVAPIAARLAAHADLERYDLSSLNYLVWAATAANEPVAAAVTRRSGARWLLGYGTTELPGLHCNPAEYPDSCRLDSPGLPRSDAEIRLVDPDTLADVEPGQVGEIVARSPAVMLGYLPEAANEGAFMPGGWFRTGDLGRIDDSGWLYIVDRLKDLIKVSGFQVAPAEIEGVLSRHPEVTDCAVFGVSDDERGEAPVVAVVLRSGGGLDAGGILDWLRERLSRYKVPRDVVELSEIPRTASGKTLRRQLREEYDAKAEVRSVS